MYSAKYVIWVHFFTPIDGETDFFFSSKKKIYERFTAEQVGLTLQSMYVEKVSDMKVTRTCIIKKCNVNDIPEKYAREALNSIK